MDTLHDRINRVIHTSAFEHVLEQHGIDLIEFQCTWDKISGGDFNKLPQPYREAILVGEEDLHGCKEIALA